MSKQYSEDHIGTLSVFLQAEVTIEAPSVASAVAVEVMEALNEGDAVTFSNTAGVLYAVSPAHFIAANWEPVE